MTSALTGFKSATAMSTLTLHKFMSSSQLLMIIVCLPLQTLVDKNYDLVSKFLTFSSSLIVCERNMQLVRIGAETPGYMYVQREKK